MAWTAPGSDGFKSRFVRDFPYAPSSDPNNFDFVTDADINAAIAQASASFNTGIGAPDAALTEMFLLLSAYFLVESLKLAQNGQNSQAEFLANSKSVGGVSVGYNIPEHIAKDQTLARFGSNGYGMQYLNMALPYLIGGVAMIPGAVTNA